MSHFPSSSGVDFLDYFVLIFGSEQLSDEEVQFLQVITQLDYSQFSQIQGLKDFGNTLFRQDQFDQAGNCYDMACRLLSVSLKDKNHLDLPSTVSLAVSLCLNLAACATKLLASDVTLTYCSMVLNFFPRNAKALFRKAVALKKLNRLSEACTTLEEAELIEPHNKDINQALVDVRQSLAINKNGKRVVVESLNANDIRQGKMLVCSLPSQEPVSISSPHGVEAGMADMMAEPEPVSSTSSTLCSGVQRKVEQSPDVPMVSASCSAPDTIPIDTEGCNSSPSTKSKPSRIRFTNKKRPHHTLHLSSQDYENLLHGKNLGFYHPRSMSVLRVRTLTSKTIQTGTPHEEFYGTAEVPTSSPTPENYLQSVDIEQTQSFVLFQEDSLLQVDKKTRLTSDTSCASKTSSVQFKFAAVRNHSPTTESPTVDPCHTKGRRGRVSAISKKRCLVTVDVLASFCRYTPKSATILRMKRKEVQLIEFDAHYHPPFKKRRLVSLVGTTSVVSSNILPSFGVIDAPPFVI